MPSILIADACKPSLVMSSEVFKDKITGACIYVADSGRTCLEVAGEKQPDMIVVDFDLPDADGITLIHALRKIYDGPILLTAFPDEVVNNAVEEDLFAFNDAGGWIKKPVKFDDLAEKIDHFLINKYRITKRFTFNAETTVSGKGAGRGKRAPKITGQIINVSIGGACIALDETMKMTKTDELSMSMELPVALDEGKVKVSSAPKKGASKAAAKSKSKKAPKKCQTTETKIKCKLAWLDKKEQKVGLRFDKLTESQKQGIRILLRDLPVEELGE